MNARDRLRIGSVTKTFTATVVLQLAAEHRVALDAPVARYLPGLIEGNGHDGRKITVRQLLQHTSGLPDYLDSPAWDHFERLRFRHFEPRELIARALRMPRPEGSGFHYATTNYLVTGLIVEKVTGRSAESEITRRIIDPLRLHDTYCPGDDPRPRGPHSHSYFTTDQGTGRVDGTDWNMTFGGVGGALVSSSGDLERFFAALLGGRLLPGDRCSIRSCPTSTGAVTANRPLMTPSSRYAG